MARYADRLADIENRYGALNSSEEEDDGLGVSPRNRPHYADDAELYEEGEVSQLSLVPTVQDPKLWMLKCKPGLEKELCVSLLQKYFNMAKAGAPLNIKSAYTHEGLKGYFYVEAYKADDVRAGCKGIRDLHWFKPVMVPIKEMVPVLSVESRVADVEIGSWARCKRGTYAGDICKVMDKDEDRVRVKVVPRIQLWDDEEDEDNIEGKTAKKRPASRLLDREALEGINEDIREDPNQRDPEDDESLITFRGEHLTKKGHLLRYVNLRSLELNVAPSFDELHAYEPKKSGAAGEDGKSQTSPRPDVTGGVKPSDLASMQLVRGDTVLAVKGDMKGLLAKIVDVLPNDKGRASDLEVLMMPIERPLPNPIKYPANALQKSFNDGDHVRVIQGKYKGHTGMVLEVKPKSGTVKLVSDTDQEKPVEVFCHQLVPSSHDGGHVDTTTQSLSGGKYQLLDMVSLRSDTTTVGVLVKIEQNNGTILTTTGRKMVGVSDILGPQLFSAVVVFFCGGGAERNCGGGPGAGGGHQDQAAFGPHDGARLCQQPDPPGRADQDLRGRAEGPRGHRPAHVPQHDLCALQDCRGGLRYDCGERHCLHLPA